ncbi:CHC2 zinc finger domain-containing protein [Janthinobacterium sp. SUN176]|uniref:CHC2 zinc finger domain-containing protein n=1 Tax=Janthinobacterium sp. SUN176 TaxID=3014788 RepID=UPI002713EF0E|nr:CHC2 zinc finger domain-containing protein [Janthinobacterium sp. SUN176]MDO8073794.1 CHC2 zinc finger domain-containing protein [Janthinobacterium sp. SUN176]
MDRYDISDLLTKAPLEDVVRRLGIDTERRGSQTLVLCPFHQDTRPSLTLYRADGTSPAHFHCFACGTHGTAIDLVKQVEGLEFLPAVAWLAQQFGAKPLRLRSGRQDERKASSETALDFALRTFDAQHDAERFKSWCFERDFNDGFLYRQGLRCITRSVLVEALQGKDVGERIELLDGLENLGLIKRLRSRSSSSQWKLDLLDQFQDCFHDGRVIIPIRSSDANKPKVGGFAGRALQNVPQEGVAKYLLTAGFDKSSHLFNATDAFKAVKEALKNNQQATLYLVEGFLDALRLLALGQPAVALMGTSLSNQQLGLLKALAENAPGKGELVYSVFLDSDSAGFGGAGRLVRRLLDLQGVDLRWVGLPWRTDPGVGKDPDTSLRSLASSEQATAWLRSFELPAEGLLLAAELGSQDASELQASRWNQLATTSRERALFRTALTVKRLYGHRLPEVPATRLRDSQLPWAQQLHGMLAVSNEAKPPMQRSLYLDDVLPRAALARRLAYHGARRGELPCDEEAWQTLNSNEYLFDQTALHRLEATLQKNSWHQAAPFDAVHLPRKLTGDKNVLDDPRLKVMPHPADLHAQQLLLNELLTLRHDRLTAGGQTFSACIPAVRWYASRQEVVVTGTYEELNEPDLELDEPKTLSFGYQIDMDVLEGDRIPTDQGMFRPFGQCWRDFMTSLAHQCHAIGPRVHVLRLDAKRYYDSIQRYVVRDELLKPLSAALRDHNPEGFKSMFGLPADSPELDGALERLLTGLIFGYEYHDPEIVERTRQSKETVGIPQGPVLSAYIGTIALFPVDHAARKFIRRTRSEEAGSDGKRRPRAGYARYVDDVVLFADSEELLKELREVLQAKAAERSIALIHKGERVRSGTPIQVMRQLNDGRGLAASVPAWAHPIVGDGEADWSLGDDLPKVDRQCALQMLRDPALMERPEDIANHVKAAMTAPDLRANDLGLCARWLWWYVAAVRQPADPESAWASFRTLWDDVCENHDWAAAFAKCGYDMLFAVEGLDRLLDPNPWQANGQFLAEVDKNRNHRIALARLVCKDDFFRSVRPATNRDHVARRARLIARKARRLAGEGPVPPVLTPQSERSVTDIEWLCLAGTVLMSPEGDRPLAALQDRELVSYDELGLAHGVIEQLRKHDSDVSACAEAGLAIDFVVRSAPPQERLNVLSKFRGLLSNLGSDQERRLISHLPVLSHQNAAFYEIDAKPGTDGRYLYRCALRQATQDSHEVASQFVHAALFAGPSGGTETTQVSFELIGTIASTVSWGRSLTPQAWNEVTAVGTTGAEARTHQAAHLFLALLSMHQVQGDEKGETTYVPFLPQLFREGEGDQTTLHLVADPVPRNLLGVSAWYHDRDERVQSENVPLADADLWRVGWAVADILGVAADMAGETGARDELLDESERFDDEAHAKHALEGYVLRQQLRKLQGSYLSGAPTSVISDKAFSLPGTVKRALKLLLDFPADKGLDAQVRHAILVETETRAMAMRMQARSGDDLRHVLHRTLPDALNRLPLWALEGLELRRPTSQSSELRPDLALMLALYRALYPISAETDIDRTASSLRMALALAAVGVGLRGSVAALWGYAADLGSRRMEENLSLPAKWAMPDMARLDPEGDYKAMRKLLFDGNWPELSKASPWKWMLALIGLLNTSFAQAFDLPSLEALYKILSAWQTTPASADDSDPANEPWPFDALPRFTLQQCEDLMQALPSAMCDLDQKRGMRVVCVQGRTFGRSRDTNEFRDAVGAGWQMTKPQYTSLYANSLEEHRPFDGNRIFKVWTETRRIADNDLLAVHTLDNKLGKWLPSQPVAVEVIPMDEAVSLQPVRQQDFPSVIDQVAENPEALADSQLKPIAEQLPATQQNDAIPNEGSPQSRSGTTDGVEEGTTESMHSTGGNDSSMHMDRAAGDSPIPLNTQEEIDLSQKASKSNHETSTVPLLDRLGEWQSESWKNRLGGETSHDQEARISSHFRVALFQCRVEESYSHPIAEVGLGGLPLAKASQEALRAHLEDKSQFKDLSKAAQRHSEFRWQDERRVISWPEHRRRTLLRQALRACRDLKVQLLVLPEVSVRPDTVAWLKEQLRNYPGLAVLAGTYRQFEQVDNSNHLTEKLTLLWQPDKALEVPFGLEGDMGVIELQRGKKYRAVAAHELFRPDTKTLEPLYTEEKIVEALRGIRGRAKKGEWSADQLIPLLGTLIHGPQKLRYCMELICSELFMLTSPANRSPLEQELAKMLQLFGGNPSEAKELVNADILALGELLTSAQRNRERRSVLIVPACTSRSNDYWHAGQASVLASGTATVFCNAANKKLGVGGSCFIGIDSVTHLKPDHAGTVRLLTPYHGWSKGILQPDCKGALSTTDQALVVVDIDPVHVVSGKPRPQLLPEPMSLVAYLPIVEVIDKIKNAKGLEYALGDQLTVEGGKRLHEMLTNEVFPEACGLLHDRDKFLNAFENLLDDKTNNILSPETGGEKVEIFKDFFGDPSAVRERILAWIRDRHQQPAPKAGERNLEPAWLDFLIADLTWRPSDDPPKIRVPPWIGGLSSASTKT